MTAIEQHIAQGTPSFHSSNKYDLQITQERWTKVGFHTTREHGQRVAHG